MDTGVKFPQTAATLSAAPENAAAWQTVDNIKTDIGTWSSITTSSFDLNLISWRLVATNFDFSIIPDGSTIDGVTVTIKRYPDGAAPTAIDYRVQLVDDVGALVGDNYADTINNWNPLSTIKNYGGVADKWNAALTAAMVKSANFGVVLSAKATKNDQDVYCEYIKMTVYYTPAGWSNIAKVHGVASADMAKVNGVAVADVAKFNGVAV